MYKLLLRIYQQSHRSTGKDELANTILRQQKSLGCGAREPEREQGKKRIQSAFIHIRLRSAAFLQSYAFLATTQSQ